MGGCHPNKILLFIYLVATRKVVSQNTILIWSMGKSPKNRIVTQFVIGITFNIAACLWLTAWDKNNNNLVFKNYMYTKK